MKALIRLYPHSPFVLCNFDHETRRLDYHNIYMVQPMPVIELRDSYEEDMLYTAHREMIINRELVFACPFNLSFNMFVRRNGEGFTLPLWPDSEVAMVKFINPFPRDILLRESYYPYSMQIPTTYIHPHVETLPSYNIYFPQSNLCFDGRNYWIPDSVPEELIIEDVNKHYAKGLENL